MENVFARTKEKYQQYELGPRTWSPINLAHRTKIDVRDTTHRVLRFALCFKEIVSAGVAFPTGHVSSAWTVVSLDLTVCSSSFEIE